MEPKKIIFEHGISVKLLKKVLWAVLYSIPLLTATYSTSRPALYALAATYNFPELKDLSNLKNLDQQRKIQKHYLDYGIYIPIDDIILNQKEYRSSTQASLMTQVCGSGLIYVWVPFRFRIPVLGEKVTEWCLRKN